MIVISFGFMIVISFVVQIYPFHLFFRFMITQTNFFRPFHFYNWCHPLTPHFPFPHTLQHLQFGRPRRWLGWHGEHLLGGVGSPVREVPPHHDGVCRPPHQDPRQVLVPQEFPLSILQGIGWVDGLLMLKIEEGVWWFLCGLIYFLAPLLFCFVISWDLRKLNDYYPKFKMDWSMMKSRTC